MIVIKLLTSASSLARPVLIPDAAHLLVSESWTDFSALYKENMSGIRKWMNT